LGPDGEILEPYLKAYQSFMESGEWKWDAIEVPAYNESLWYAGTPDRKGRRKQRKLRAKRVLVDLKATFASSPATGVQLGGYELLEPDGSEPFDERLGLRLKKDGTFELTPYPDERIMFRSLLNMHKWRVRNGQLG
jgi:hypothetical protein